MNGIKKDIGVIAAHGGYKALALYPLIKAIREKGYPIRAYAASGSGALMFAMMLSDFSRNDIIHYMSEIYDYNKIFKKVNKKLFFDAVKNKYIHPDYFEHYGFFKPDYLINILRKMFGDKKIEDLPETLMIQATNLHTIEGVELTKGPLVDALYATNAVYPFFSPITIENQELVTGVNSYSLPLIPSVKKYDIDIAICFLYEPIRTLPTDNIYNFYISLFNRVYSLGQQSQLPMAIMINENLECMIHEIKFLMSCSEWSVQNPEFIIQKGEFIVLQMLSELDEALSSHHTSDSGL